MRPPPKAPRRSTCPINATLEVLGDRWSLLIVRDMLFAGSASYKEFAGSAEGIATNVLASRLEQLEGSGIIESKRAPTDGRKTIYRLTQKGLDLAPLMLDMSLWGVKYEAGVAPSRLRRWKADREAFMAEMREQWLGARG